MGVKGGWTPLLQGGTPQTPSRYSVLFLMHKARVQSPLVQDEASPLAAQVKLLIAQGLVHASCLRMQSQSGRTPRGWWL